MSIKPIIITGLDLETTGLKQEDGHRIIEFAAAIYSVERDTREIKKLGQYAQQINPMRSIDADASKVHGIYIDDLRTCPTWGEVAPKIQKVLNVSDILIIHNAKFDAPFVGLELARINLSIKPDVLTYCTMENGRWATPNGKNPNLGELCYALDVEYDPSKAHGAIYDVDVMMSALFKGISLNKFALPL